MRSGGRGGGVAGLAAAIHLRQGGLSVLCIEPEPFPHLRVGESLDWSFPGLLAELGLSRDTLVGECVATFKRNIKVVSPGGVAAGQPPPWWGKPPLRFENLTVHVDRQAMDDRLYARARDVGVEFLWDRASRMVMDGQRVAAVETAGGQRVEAAWFVDASGRNVRLFACQLGIRRVDYGREKVSFWCYLETPCENEGTTFYIEAPAADYLSWIWEIPINPTTASVGCVLPAEVVKEEGRHGRRPGEILCDRLARFPRFAPLLEGQPELEVRATAYRCFVHRRACGPNWILAGESVSLPDALTGNGVTAAFRHAAEGARWILEARGRGRLGRRQRRVYGRNVRRLGRMFNHSIETAVYRAPIRRGLGLTAAQSIYVSCAFTLNALYSRFRPRRRVSMLVFGLRRPPPRRGEPARPGNPRLSPARPRTLWREAETGKPFGLVRGARPTLRVLQECREATPGNPRGDGAALRRRGPWLRGRTAPGGAGRGFSGADRAMG